MNFSWSHSYAFRPEYKKRVAYFSMEFGIDQALKTYAGGLGFLAGSHMRSAYQLQQNIVGVGILWKYGYYDQVRKGDQTMDVLFQEKTYGFLKKTDLKFTIRVSGHDVFVTAYYLDPEVFKTAPIFFLSTDVPENDYLSHTICHKLYDSNPETKIAASILLGEGGARLLEKLNWIPEVYHLNESHALPLAFFLYSKYKNLAEVRKHLVFTNHTPEPGGNEKNNVSVLKRMGYFQDLSLDEIVGLTTVADNLLDHTLCALQMAGIANGVSKLHQQTLRRNWTNTPKICPIISITNAQDFGYWANKEMYDSLHNDDQAAIMARKKIGKRELFEIVADQNGEIYDENVFTVVFAKRFTGYKRPELLLNDINRFQQIASSSNRPIQFIWAGKPYPVDYGAIALFDKIVNVCKGYRNCSTVVGYELKLSRQLKRGADLWLNTPRMFHEASGTSGMAAAMNGAVSLSSPDGWYPEFAVDGKNGFVIPACDSTLPDHLQDDMDARNMYDILENKIIPLYYDRPNEWLAIVSRSLKDIVPQFDSQRMAAEYYEKMYLPVSGLTSPAETNQII